MKKLFFVATAFLCGAISANAVDYLVQTGKEGDAVWTDAAINTLKTNGSTNVKVISFDTAGVAKLPTTGTIWFAKGTYNFTESYDMKEGAKLIGGFAGTETSVGARKTQNGKPYDFVNATILNVEQPKEGVIRLFKTDAVKSIDLNGLTIQNSKHTGNGGVYKVHATNNIKFCTFKNNSAADGGAILVYNSSATIEGCLFEGNTAANGGAIRIGGTTTGLSVTIKDCDFKNNEATNTSNGGGAISKVQAIALNATGCTFDGNKAVYGGALFIYTTNAKDVVVENCAFANNVATTNGGAVYMHASCTDTVTINRCKMYLNTAADGAAIYDGAANYSIITNNVIYNNGCVVDVNKKYIGVATIKPLLLANNTICFNYGRVNITSNVAKAVVANNIVWGNRVQAGSSTAEKPAFTANSFNFVNAATGETACTVSNNYAQHAVSNNVNSSNNVVIDDQKMTLGFEAPTDTFGVVPAERTAKYEKVLNANFALTSGSEFIDKGIDLALVTTDILGTARVAGKYDVGAYEFVGGGVGSAVENTEKAPLDIQAALQAGEVYNLLGQRVGELQAGNIYIVGGQKVLMQ